MKFDSDTMKLTMSHVTHRDLTHGIFFFQTIKKKT